MELKNFNEFQHAKKTIKKVSEDSSKIEKTGTAQYLSEDERMVVDFDKVKTQYLNNINLSEEYAASVDALFQTEDGELHFVEFKNGDFEPADIHKKVKDSLLIFLDITKQTLDFTRANANFILVVNDDKLNKLSAQQLRALSLACKGKVDFAIWGLYKLRAYCFKNVFAYSATKFDNWLNKIEII